MSVTSSVVGDALEVRAELHIAAPAERVFEHLTDPVKLNRWMGIGADLEPVPGGVYRCTVTPTHRARGTFVEVTPFERVVYTWGWEGSTPPPGATTVEITLQPAGDGTLLRMVHRHGTIDDVASHAEGWAHYLPRLVAVAEGRDPGPDPWLGGQEEANA